MKRPSMVKPIGLLFVGSIILLAPVVASARGHVDIGVGIGVGPGYYGRPGPYYYGGGYYYPPRYYGPSFYYPPPDVIYEQAPEVVYESEPATPVEAPAAFWYYCPPTRAYFPYVRECPSGWQAVSAPPQQAASANRRPAPAPAGQVTYRLGDVLFATAQSQLQGGATSTLDSLLASIRKEPNRRIVIEGHTDATGRGADNLRLSQSRADTVKQYLIAHGIPADRITAVGKGDTGPIASNSTAEGRQQNRRVDIVVS